MEVLAFPWPHIWEVSEMGQEPGLLILHLRECCQRGDLERPALQGDGGAMGGRSSLLPPS